MFVFIRLLLKRVFFRGRYDRTDRFYQFAWKWLKYPPRKRVDNFSFLGYQFDVPDVPSFIWQVNGIFFNEIYKFKTEDKNQVIYDCGANIGTSLLYFSKTYPNATITGFEADVDVAEIASENIKKNNCSNVTIVPKAVWTDDKGVSFSADNADGGSVLGDSNVVTVPSVRLKECLQKEQKINMLKMDIEGAEYDVIKDCQEELHKVENLFIEYHSWVGHEQRLSDILSILELNKFRYYIEGETSYNPQSPLCYHFGQHSMDLQLNIYAYRP